MTKSVFIVAVAFVFQFFSGWAIAQKTIPNLDGADWKELNINEKAGFVTGFMSGTHWLVEQHQVSEILLNDMGTFSLGKTVWEDVLREMMNADTSKQTNANMTRKYNAVDVTWSCLYDTYLKAGRIKKVVINTSAANIIVSLDAFYNNKKNEKILISNAIHLVNKKIKGASDEEINVILPYLRGEKPIPAFGIIPVYDKNGKVTKTIEFP